MSLHSIMERGEAAPDLPRAPKKYSQLKGRTISHCPPTTYTIGTLFGASMAGWQYLQGNHFLAGSFTGLSVLLCSAAACHWTLVGGRAMEQSVGDMREMMKALNDLVDWYKGEVASFTEQIDKFEALVTRLPVDLSEVHQGIQGDNAELKTIAEKFSNHIQRLELFVNLHDKFKEATKELRDELIKMDRRTPDLKKKQGTFEEMVKELESFPNRLEAKVKDLDTENEDLAGEIRQLKESIGALKEYTETFVNFYRKMRDEQQAFAEELAAFKRENKLSTQMVAGYHDQLDRLSALLPIYEKLAHTIEEEPVVSRSATRSGKKRVKRRAKRVEE